MNPVYLIENKTSSFFRDLINIQFVILTVKMGPIYWLNINLREMSIICSPGEIDLSWAHVPCEAKNG